MAIKDSLLISLDKVSGSAAKNGSSIDLGATRLRTGEPLYFVVHVDKANTSGTPGTNYNTVTLKSGSNDSAFGSTHVTLLLNTSAKQKKGYRAVYELSSIWGDLGRYVRAELAEAGSVAGNLVSAYFTSERPRNYVAAPDALTQL